MILNDKIVEKLFDLFTNLRDLNTTENRLEFFVILKDFF